jgi:hypothetical protein
MAELVTISVVDPFAGSYVCTFPALVSGEEAPVDVTVEIAVQVGFLEIEATSFRDVCVELGETEHPTAHYAAEMARRCAAACQRPASGIASALLDGGVTVRASYSG